jgi:hypothetical protein
VVIVSVVVLLTPGAVVVTVQVVVEVEVDVVVS